MHPEDATLAKSLQKNFLEKSSDGNTIRRLQSEFPKIDRKNVSIILELALEIQTADSDHPPPVPRKEKYLNLLEYGLPATVAALLEYDQSFKHLELADLPLIACTEDTIGRWIEARSSESSDARSLAKELIDLCLEEPEKALGSALARWTCRNIDLKSLRRLIPVVAADGQQQPGKDLLGIVLLRDKGGDFITRWLKEYGRTEATAERIKASPRLIRHVLNSSEKWFQHPNADLLTPIYMELIGDLPSSTGKPRAELSGRLLSLAGSLVPIAERHPAATNLLQQLQTLGLNTWMASSESKDRHRTWAFIQAGNQALSSDEEDTLSPKQAKHLGVAVLRARKGKDPLAELESAYVNLGGERYGCEGETVTYDATIHNDMDGGLLPGDPVTIIRSGIRCGDSGIVKADVRAAQSV